MAESFKSAPFFLTFFIVIVDETTDIFSVEQVVVCFRSVSETFEVQENFVGLYEV